MVLFAWQVVGENTPDPAAKPDADKSQIKHENLCKAVGGTWDSTKKACT